MNQKKVAIPLFFIVLLLGCSIVNSSFGQENNKNFLPQPTPSWIKKYPKPKLEKKSDYKDNLHLIHHEIQYNHELGETYYRYFYYLRNKQGVNQIKSFRFYYQPDYEEVFINDLIIHRGRKKIVIDSQLKVENNIHEKQIDEELYDIDGNLVIFFDRTRAGDILEITYTTRGFQPDLHGILMYRAFKNYELKGSQIVRILSAIDEPLNYKMFASKQTPKISKSDGVTTLEFIKDQKNGSVPIQNPLWYNSNILLSATNMNSLSELLALNLKNFNLDEPPSKEIQKKTNEVIRNIADKEAQINAILQYIQGEIEYLDYEKIEPKKPDVVLRQGFGDCKSMSLLTVKMLESIDVEAWPVIVKMHGTDERWSNIHFMNNADHAVLEFVHDKDTILFDATKDFQRGSIYQKYHSDFKYGFRVIEGNDQVSKLKHNDYNHITTEATIIADEIEGTKYHSLQVTFEGDVANENNLLFEKYGVPKVYHEIYRDLPTDFGFDIKESDLTLTYESDQKIPKSKLSINTNSRSKLLFTSDNSEDSNVFIPGGISRNIEALDYNELGKYFSLPKMDETTQIYKLIHPKADSIQEDSIHIENDWIRFSKKVKRIQDTVTIKYHLKFLKSYLDEPRYHEVAEELRRINDELLPVRFGEKPVSFNRDYVVLEDKSFARREMYETLQAILIVLFIASIIFFIGFFLGRKKNRKNKSSS